MDLPRGHVHLFRRPRRETTIPEDAYQDHAIVPAEGTLSPLVEPPATIGVDQILPGAGSST